MGINIFAVVGSSQGQVSTKQAYYGVFPFVVMEILVLTVLLSIPALTLYLPRLMIG